MRIISTKQLDCLFIFPPGSGNAGNDFSYNIGSAYIISYLRQNGFRAGQFIHKDLIGLRTCLKEILDFNARVVGFTVFNTNFLLSVLIAEQLKTISPHTIVVFGGPTATNYAEFILEKYPFIDLCFRKEGEETFLQFISALSGKKYELDEVDLLNIRGISYRSSGSVRMNPDSNIFKNDQINTDFLDKYPSPYLSGIIPAADSYEVGLLTARGCNQNCIYCNCAVMSNRRFVTHSVDRIISELDFLSASSSGNKSLNIFDDAFSLIPQRAKAICRSIIDNHIKIKLSCITRCDCVDEELLDLMKEAGFVAVGFSLESANPKSLRIIGKVHMPEDIPSDGLERESLFIDKLGKMSNYAKKIGIETVFCSIMVGLPHETLEEANKTIETIDNNPAIDYYIHNLLTIYHGTPLSSNFSKYGYRLNCIDDNPVFSRTLYPDDLVTRVNVSSKAQFHSLKKSLDNNTVSILSLVSGSNNSNEWFNNMIIMSDTIEMEFVEWLREVIAVNGTIIQIYSNEEGLFKNLACNYEAFVRFYSPSLNIRNFYLENDQNIIYLSSYSPLIRDQKDKQSIGICDFRFFRSVLEDSKTDFLRTLCKESDSDDADSAYEFYCKIKQDKDLFNCLINSKPFPYFVNLCKWTAEISNCRKRNTIIVNSNSELRLCWYGSNIAKVGDSFKTIIKNFETYQKMVTDHRKCNQCIARGYCIICSSPYPLSESDYCIKQKASNINNVAELFISLDTIKQYA
jgi:radical SAM superfamily enzyme YgiQ (UPF0313 family)